MEGCLHGVAHPFGLLLKMHVDLQPRRSVEQRGVEMVLQCVKFAAIR